MKKKTRKANSGKSKKKPASKLVKVKKKLEKKQAKKSTKKIIARKKKTKVAKKQKGSRRGMLTNIPHSNISASTSVATFVVVPSATAQTNTNVILPALTTIPKKRKRRKNMEDVNGGHGFAGEDKAFGRVNFDENGLLEPKVPTIKIKNKIVRKKPGTKSINYFDDNTQQAIVEYQKALEVKNKNNIYLEKIFPAFDSLVENLINVYGFTVAHESRVDLKNECLEFLYTALPKFNAEKGSKAFSYFNVVAKHWLTIKSKQNAKKVQNYLSLDNKEAIGVHDMETIEKYSIAPDGEELMIEFENKAQVQALIKEVSDKARTENEKSCVKAINVLMDSIDDIDLLNKRAILLYLREITGLSSKQLSIVLANLKKYYKDAKRKDELS